ncbi:MAG: hypothetical protein ACOCZB_01500 [Spirochaetota bacterium]
MQPERHESCLSVDYASEIRYKTGMVSKDPLKEISRLMSEIASLNAQILQHVYHRAWDRDLLRRLHDEVEARKAELEQISTHPGDLMRRGDDPRASET